MPEIINCHIHTFTQDHVPKGFPPFPLNLMARSDGIRRGIIWSFRNLWPFSNRDLPHRYANFLAVAAYESQEEIFMECRGRYPLGTKFVVLPMDLRGMRRGRIKAGLHAQHEELAQMAEKYPGVVLPFVHIDPRSVSEFGGPDPVEFVREFHERGFVGVKLYPPLGYAADDESLWPLYEYAEANNLPVMTHCSAGGVKDKKFSPNDVREAAAPHRYRKALRDFPALRICLAHFGGHDDWDRYLKGKWTDDNAPLEKMNWLSQISTMIKSGEFPNLYTDISYTVFRFKRYVPALKVFLTNDRIRARTLFGSDYYMIEQEKFPERELSMALRAELGEDKFWEIAHDNAREYLEG